MSKYTGAYTRGGNPEAMYAESHLYLEMLAQAELAAIDSDFNDIAYSRLRQLRRIIYNTIGNASPNNGFQIQQSSLSTTNNFQITGGDGTDDGAGRMFVAGYPLFLASNVDFTGTYNSLMTKIAPMVTGVTTLVLTDSAANWTVNSLVGKTLVPNIQNPGTTFTIASNTANTITVTSGNLVAATALYNFYQILPSTPGSARTDCVYLDVFYDEQNASEDPNFVNPDMVPTQSGPLRIILRQYVRILEGNSTAPGNFVDSNGRQHYTWAIALLNRTATSAITSSMIQDLRRTFTKPDGQFAGYYVSMGNTGSVPAAGSQVVTTNFSAQTPNGSATQAGIITTSPTNLVTILDQNGNEIEETTTGNHNQVYGRITYSSGVWTLSYYYLNAGVETAVTNLSTQTSGVTNVQMAYVPKVYAASDPTKPLFASGAPLNDLVAGEIPLATTSAPGIVQLESSSSDTSASHVVTANDTRLGTVQAELNTGGSLGSGSLINFVNGSNVTMSVAVVSGVITVTINASASGGFPGYYGGSMFAESGGGSPGSSSLVSRGDHYHPNTNPSLSTYFFQVSQSAGVNLNASADNPVMAVQLNDQGGVFSVGLDVGGTVQACYGGFNSYQTGNVANRASPTDVWAWVTFANGSQVLENTTNGGTGIDTTGVVLGLT